VPGPDWPRPAGLVRSTLVSANIFGSSARRRATCNADLNAPVGFDEHGYGVRSGGGERLHRAQREPYGVAFGEGDVVGLYISLGAAEEPAAVLLEGEAFLVEQHLPAPPGAASAAGSSAGARVIAVAVNGVLQGVAFEGLPGGAPPFLLPLPLLRSRRGRQTSSSLP
jgi:hypothetical protein